MSKILTPRQYVIASPEEAAAAGLEARETGIVLCETNDGRRVTVVGDADYTRLMVEASKRGVLKGLEIPPEMFPLHYSGWPHQW